MLTQDQKEGMKFNYVCIFACLVCMMFMILSKPDKEYRGHRTIPAKHTDTTIMINDSLLGYYDVSNKELKLIDTIRLR